MWEYLIKICYPGTNEIEFLDECGARGWELCCIVDELYYFKRRKE